MPNITLLSITVLVLVTVTCCFLYSKRLNVYFQQVTESDVFEKIGFKNRNRTDFRNNESKKILVEKEVFPPKDLVSNKWLNLTESRKYSNYGDGTCLPNDQRETLKKIFLEWTRIAEKLKILYFLNFGSLLGAWRNADLIPTDSDIDLVVNLRDAEVLQKYGIKDGYNLYIQKDWKLPEDHRRRFNCKGMQVKSQVDSCAFIEPIGRLIEINSGWRLDIYAYNMLFDTVIVFNDFKSELRKDFVFPLKKCKFLDVESYCPNQPKPILTMYYGSNLRPNEVCKNTKWVKNG